MLHDAQEGFEGAAEGKAFKKYLKALKTKVLEDLLPMLVSYDST